MHSELSPWLECHKFGVLAEIVKRVSLVMLMCRWAQENSVQTLLHPGVFHNNIRGLSAAEDLEAGAVAVRVPEVLLISQETAKQSDLVCNHQWCTACPSLSRHLPPDQQLHALPHIATLDCPCLYFCEPQCYIV